MANCNFFVKEMLREGKSPCLSSGYRSGGGRARAGVSGGLGRAALGRPCQETHRILCGVPQAKLSSSTIFVGHFVKNLFGLDRGRVYVDLNPNSLPRGTLKMAGSSPGRRSLSCACGGDRVFRGPESRGETCFWGGLGALSFFGAATKLRGVVLPESSRFIL
jgi:hypothetical protein